MKRLGVLLIVVLLLSCWLSGQEASSGNGTSLAPPTRGEVETFLQIMQVRQRLESTIRTQQQSVDVEIHNMLHKAFPEATPEQKAQMESLVAKCVGEMIANYPFDDVLRDMIPIYQSHFSSSDLKAVAAFYSSTVGQKVLREMPAITQETQRVALLRLQPNIDKAIEKVNVELGVVEGSNQK